jgi:hypothetical protein
MMWPRHCGNHSIKNPVYSGFFLEGAMRLDTVYQPLHISGRRSFPTIEWMDMYGGEVEENEYAFIHSYLP